MSIPNPTFIRTPAEAIAYRKKMSAEPDAWKLISMDTEFNEVEETDRTVRELYFFQFSNGVERVCVEGPVTSEAKGFTYNLVEDHFKDIIENPKIKKIYSTMIADVTTFQANGINPRGFHADTQVMDWLYDENRMRHGLKECAMDHCKIFMREYKEVFAYPKLKKSGEPSKRSLVASMREAVWGHETYSYIPWTGEEGREKAEDYACLDPYATFKVYEFLKARLMEQNLWDHYLKVERPFGETLMVMEHRGIKIDLEEFKSIHVRVHTDILRSQHLFRAKVRKPDINLKSPLQLSKLFFEELKWKVLRRNKPKNGERGSPSLDAQVLEDYATKLHKREAQILMDYRKLSTLDNTFIKGALKNNVGGVLYTAFKHTGTKTGRISSGDKTRGKVNLQNIPARNDPFKLRRSFIARPGKVFVVADYSQIELYIVGQVSKDERMIQAFSRGEDLHMITASGAFNLELPKDPKTWDQGSADWKRWHDECSAWKKKYKAERDAAKIINFGINYGMTPFKLSKDQDIALEEAERRVEAYFDLYPGVASWGKEQVEFCREHLYVLTPVGRRRRIPDINAQDDKVAGHAANQAKNSPIQGFAGDVIKVAMNIIERDEKLNEFGAEMLIQVHDELVVEVSEDHGEETLARVIELMESPYPEIFTDVKIKVEGHVGRNWLDAKGG